MSRGMEAAGREAASMGRGAAGARDIPFRKARGGAPGASRKNHKNNGRDRRKHVR